jgi:hypothetical protein
LFELGARWGCGKHHIPLLARGAGADLLREPLKATNALRLGDESDVLQLVEDIASVLGRTSESPNSFVKKAHKIVELSNAGVINGVQTRQTSPQKRKKRVAAKEIIPKEPRDPNRIEADVEKVLEQLAGEGNIVTDPLDDPDAFGMHRVRLERCIALLERAGYLKKSAADFGSNLYIVTPSGKQYLLDHSLI